MTDRPYSCAAPWVHLHAQANGDLLPCCIANTSLPVGNLKTQTMEEAWHGEAMVKLRANMLSGKPSAECTYCYNVEQSGGHSPRHNFNRVFGPSLAAQLPLDAAPPLRLSYIDFRFSNLCNFKCRTCGPHASSAWMEDWRDLWELPQPLEAVTPLKPGQSWAALIEPHLDHVEEVYFAGGEPLIMPEHYWFLQELISRKRTQVRLRYNTNFTFLAHKHGDAVDLWRHFDDVFVGASIDAAGSRGEYLRKGLRWRQILENRRRLRAEAPHVSFKVSAVVGLMNTFAVADMHREMVEGGFISRSTSWTIPLTSAPSCCLGNGRPACRRTLRLISTGSRPSPAPKACAGASRRSLPTCTRKTRAIFCPTSSASPTGWTPSAAKASVRPFRNSQACSNASGSPSSGNPADAACSPDRASCS